MYPYVPRFPHLHTVLLFAENDSPGPPSLQPVRPARSAGFPVVVMDLLRSTLTLSPVPTRDEWAALQDGDGVSSTA